MYRFFLKRVLDFVIALVALIVLLPFFLILAVVIKIDSPGPVIFKQQRFKKDRKLFNMWKFRTMRTDAPKDMPTHLLQNPEMYISRVGRVLRKFSIDETIQVVHILTGSMSIIGPRPALYNQDDLMEARDKCGANGLRPGLTGWAQVNGRDELPIEVKAALDGEYVEKMGFIMDAKCLFLTVFAMLKSDGVVEGGTGTLIQSEDVEVFDAIEVQATEVEAPDSAEAYEIEEDAVIEGEKEGEEVNV